MPSLFQIPAGTRVPLKTGEVFFDLEVGGGTTRGTLKTDVSYEATATDEYRQDFKGEWRRLFVDVSTDFGLGLTTIWLTNDVDEPPPFVEQKEEEWPVDVDMCG